MKKVLFVIALLMSAPLFSQINIDITVKNATESAIVQANMNSMKERDERISDGDYPRNYSLGFSTGIGGLNRYTGSSDTRWGAPLLIYGEKSGRIGRFKNLPDYFTYGTYFRMSKQKYTINGGWSDPDYQYTSGIWGLGVRGSVSVIPAFKDIMGNATGETEKIDVCLGFQAGYDVVTFNNDAYSYTYGYYNNYYGYRSGLRVNPFVGIKYYPKPWIGLTAEVGATSNRFLSVGVVFRKLKS